MTETGTRVPAEPTRGGGAGARHLAWILPIVAVPFLFFGFLFVTGTMINTGDPILTAVSIVPYVAALVSPVAALVVAVVVIVRIRRQAARRGPGPIERRRLEDARRSGLTPEEYGVYKGSDGSLVEPVNSASGLLVISIILTALAVFELAMIGLGILQSAGVVPTPAGATELSPVQWFFLLFALAFPIVSWRSYLRERRAQTLRLRRGLPRTLPRDPR